MKLYAPDYYNDFCCIADKCKHSCCVGWEIDIDNDTYNYYKTVHGDFRKRLALNIASGDNPHFILSKNERCPFLNKDGLCDIILNLGEDKLCQICTDHPRYRNFFDSRTEIGLGLCCEEAARIILRNPKKVNLVMIACDEDDFLPDDEAVFFNLRDKIFGILQNRDLSIENRVDVLLTEFDISLPQKSIPQWIEYYLSLEHMDLHWVDILSKHKDLTPDFTDSQFEIAFEQLLVYFIYRHLADGLYDGMLRERIAFSVLSYKIIRALCPQTIDELCDISRLYSAEIEYSEENTKALLDALK